jgi:DNA polymerase III subunit epsilon
MLPQNLAFIDVETTGLSPARDNIIEIAIIRVEGGKIIQTYETLVNPGKQIPPEITLLTGITSGELENAPDFYSIKNDIRKILDGAVFVAHNARFDYSFIRAEFMRQEESFSAKILCTAKLSRRLYPRFHRHNLDSLIDRFNIPCDTRHRALSDTKAIWNFFQIALEKHGQKKISDAIDKIMKNASLPPTISPSNISDLPETPGVYIFKDNTGTPIYIGKSINIKNRVLTHFYDFSKSPKESKIFQTISSIETETTSGELGALLLESQLVKNKQPSNNRQLRQSQNMIALVKTQTTEGYFTVRLVDLAEISISQLSDIVAVFKTQKQLKTKLAELSKNHNLCQKLLGIEKSTGACFGYQLKSCHGACIGKELPIKYNMRYTMAFTQTKIKQWPFKGPIAIREGHEAHLVYHWCYIGKTDDMELKTIHTDVESLRFDYDTYRILSSYILKKAKNNQIRILNI